MGLSYFGNDAGAYKSYINGLQNIMAERDTQVQVLFSNLAIVPSRPGPYPLQRVLKSGFGNPFWDDVLWIHEAALPSDSVAKSPLRLFCSRKRSHPLTNFLDDVSLISEWSMPHHQNSRKQLHCKPCKNNIPRHQNCRKLLHYRQSFKKNCAAALEQPCASSSGPDNDDLNISVCNSNQNLHT
jgi:hypothetical protein